MDYSQVSEYDLGVNSSDDEIHAANDVDSNELNEDFWENVSFQFTPEEEEKLNSMNHREIPENGQNHVDWINFLKDFKSAQFIQNASITSFKL